MEVAVDEGDRLEAEGSKGVAQEGALLEGQLVAAPDAEFRVRV